MKNYVRHIALDSRGGIIFSEPEAQRVSIYNDRGNLLRQIEPLERSAYAFVYPSGVAVDRSDNLYVCDTVQHRVIKFDQVGLPLGEVLNDSEHGLCFPHDVAVSNNWKIICSFADGRTADVYSC